MKEMTLFQWDGIKTERASLQSRGHWEKHRLEALNQQPPGKGPGTALQNKARDLSRATHLAGPPVKVASMTWSLSMRNMYTPRFWKELGKKGDFN